MEKLAEYRQYVRQVLETYADLPVGDEAVRREVLFDSEHDRYQVLIVGWRGHERFHSSIIHVDIIDGQVWIQQDVTDSGVAEDFVELSVPKKDIVLAFHAPYKRKFTGFGTGDDGVEL